MKTFKESVIAVNGKFKKMNFSISLARVNKLLQLVKNSERIYGITELMLLDDYTVPDVMFLVNLLNKLDIKIEYDENYFTDYDIVEEYELFDTTKYNFPECLAVNLNVIYNQALSLSQHSIYADGFHMWNNKFVLGACLDKELTTIYKDGDIDDFFQLKDMTIHRIIGHTIIQHDIFLLTDKFEFVPVDFVYGIIEESEMFITENDIFTINNLKEQLSIEHYFNMYTTNQLKD